MSTDNFMLNLIKVNECVGITFYSGSIRLEDLFENYDIPIYRPGKDVLAEDGGYQREAKQNRVAAVAHRILDPKPGQVIPNTESFVDNINLNIRSNAAEKSYVKPINKSKTDFGDMFTFSYVNTLGKFHTVDGQTRLKGALDAYRTALEGKAFELADEIANLRFQITLTFCEDKYKEAYIFYLINQYSKAIPTAGATRLLYEGKMNDDIHFVNEVSRAQKTDDVDTMKMVQYLSEHSLVWAGHIADFNEASVRNKIPINTFVRISKDFYKIVKGSIASSEIKAHDLTSEIVEAYWRGIKEAYPIMFSINNDTKYNILKAGTVEVLMMVLTRLFDHSINGRISLKSMKDKDTFKELMKNTLDNYKDKNDNGKYVSGPSLFLVGSDGVFGNYGNSKLKTAATDRIMYEVFNQLGMPTP